MLVKAITTDSGDWVIEALVPFGGPIDGNDLQGEHFHPGTDFMLDTFQKRAVLHHHGFTAKGEPIDPEVIGDELSYEVREDGVWFKILLDKSKGVAARLWDAAKNGLLRLSPGGIAHLKRPLKRSDIEANGGKMDIWPLVELSLISIKDGTYPANPYAVAVPSAKALFKSAKLDWPDALDADTDITPTPQFETTEPQQVTEPPKPEPVNQLEPQEENTEMTDKQVVEPVAPANVVDVAELEAFLEKREADKAEKARIEQLEAEAEELKALKAQIKEADEARKNDKQVNRLPNPVDDGKKTPDVQVFSKFDGFTVGQLGMAYTMLKATGAPMSGELFRALHSKAKKTNLYENQIARDDKGRVIREYSPNVNAAAMKAVNKINPMEMAIKADELHGSDVTDAGDEWVPAMWTPELWDIVRNEARVLPRFRQVEVPGESLTIPTLEGGTTVYKTAQTDDQSELTLAAAAATMSKATTGQVTLTPVKGVAWLGFTEELTEDSIVPIIPTMQQVLAADLAEQIDEILISGDTDTTSANNSDTGNGSISAAWHLLIANGLRDYALENSKASDRGTLTAEDFTAVMALIGTNGAYALDPDKLFWIFDPGVYRKALLLGETLTADKAGGIGTFQNGRLQRVFGSDVVVSDKYAKTDANGQIHNTAGNNTLGSFLCVRPDRWVVGFGRNVRIEVPARDLTSIVTDTRHLVASFRLDFQTHSGGNGAALGYNVTI